MRIILGEARRLALALFVLCGAPAFGGEVRVVVEPHGPLAATEVRLLAVGGPGEAVSASLPRAGKLEAILALAGGKGWVISAVAPGFWSAPVEVAEDQRSIVVGLWPASEVTFRLEQPRDSPLLKEVLLRLSPSQQGGPPARQPGETEVRCPTGEAGAVVCQVPGGRWDLRIKPTGFVPHYVWNRELRAGERVVLGGVRLERGVSILGRVETDEGPADGDRASVEILPDAGAPSRVVDTAPRELQSMKASARVNEWGFFQFGAMARGQYVIVVQLPGFDTVTQSISLGEEDVEIRQPFVLRRPLRLTVSIEPAVDPEHGTWQVAVDTVRHQRLVTVAEGRADPTGIWRSQPIARGAYGVRVEGGAGNLLATEAFELSDGAESLAINLPLTHVEGRVTIGDDPLAAKLWFGGESGKERIEAESDSAGRFEVLLPRPGAWKLDVRGLDRKVYVRERKAVVEPPTKDEPVELEIRLPATLLRGTVRDSRMLSVAGAALRVFGLGEGGAFLSEISDSRGEFEIEGLMEGPYRLEAAMAGRTSRPVETSIRAEVVPQPIDLILAERRRVQGRVISVAGPVPGALIIAASMTASGNLSEMGAAEANSDIEGRFEIEVPGSAAQVRLFVMAAGFTFSVSSAPVAGDDAFLLVRLDSAGGLLEIPGAVASRPSPGGVLEAAVLFVNGQPVDPLLLKSMWARRVPAVPVSPAEPVVVEAMPPGSYAYCEMTLQEFFLVLTGAALPRAEACSSGTLETGGRLKLEPRPGDS